MIRTDALEEMGIGLQDLTALYGMALKEMARTSTGLGAFGEYVFGYKPAVHHQVWIDLLQETRLKRLVIVAPPGVAKSTWCSIIYPTWRIGKEPWIHYLGTSVTATQSQLFSVAIRDTIGNSPLFKEVFPNLAPDRSKGWGESEWFVVRKNTGDPHPTLAAAGVGGAVIGRRADEIGLDDPYDERNSATALQREKVNNWLKRTLRSRLAPEGRFRAVLTRWHFDDFVSEFRMQRSHTIVAMKALSEGKEVYAQIWAARDDREVLEELFGDRLQWKKDEEDEGLLYIHDRGPALWPEWWTEAALLNERTDIGIPIFNCMYQGDPSALAGEIFTIDCFRQLKDKPLLTVAKQYWDLALKQEKTASRSACATGGMDVLGNFFLLRMRAGHYGALQNRTELERAWIEDRQEWPMLNEVGVEDCLLSYRLIEEILAETDIPIVGVVPRGDKVARARPVAAKGHAGKFFVDKTAPWWPSALEEFLEFDRGEFDDRVDALSGVYEQCAGKRWKTVKFLSV